jgi:hypothetical protein
MPPTNRVVSNNVTRKQFSYKINNCELSFSLRVDIKSELKDFLALMEMAQNEVKEEIAKLK